MGKFYNLAEPQVFTGDPGSYLPSIRLFLRTLAKIWAYKSVPYKC